MKRCNILRSVAMALLALWALPAAGAATGITVAGGEPFADTPEGGNSRERGQLGFDALMRGGDPGGRVDFSYYAPQADAEALLPRNRFEGRLQLSGTASGGGFAEVVDRYDATGVRDSPRKHLPEFDFELVQAGSHLIPLRRDSVASAHPDWEFVLTPGRVWDEPGDHDYSRAALPFALQQKNANCIHNGVLMFLFRNDGSVSKAAYQIASETCVYFKADFWGLLPARYIPQPVQGAEALVAGYRSEVALRMPVKPLSALAKTYPGTDIAKLAAPNGKNPREISLVGFVIDGTHYSGGCATRHGTYPYCESLVAPSYSLAKSVFAGLGMMRLEKRYPGAFGQRIADYVPACAAAGDWGDVSFDNALDMATGHYASDAYMRDEDEDTASADSLFQVERHADKIGYACTHYRRRGAPGSKWVYRTGDTYVLGTAMSALLKEKRGDNADLFEDVLLRDVLQPLRVSRTAQFTRRSYDEVRQPFVGWGLMWLRDDMAKIAGLLATGTGAQSILDQSQLEAALQRDPHDRGNAPLPGFRYNNGFWAHDIGTKLSGCRGEVWIPFLAGYGGLTMLVLPNGSAYYYVSDDDSPLWLDAAREAHRIRSLCP